MRIQGLLLLFVSTTALCSPLLPVRGLLCDKEAAQVLESISKKVNWKIQTTREGSVVYKSATDRITHWLEGEVTNKKRISFFLRTPDLLTFITFDPKSCKAQRSEKPVVYAQAKLNRAFTDYDMQDLVKRENAGLIYAWSPHMPLSMAGLEEIKAAARKMGLPLEVVLDPHANRELASVTVKNLKMGPAALRPMESWELYYRDLVQHYPAAILYVNGKIASPVYAGYKPRETYLRFFKKYLISNR